VSDTNERGHETDELTTVDAHVIEIRRAPRESQRELRQLMRGLDEEVTGDRRVC
jgi:hypothetical protein